VKYNINISRRYFIVKHSFKTVDKVARCVNPTSGISLDRKHDWIDGMKWE
jgi:hypothetical protein